MRESLEGLVIGYTVRQSKGAQVGNRSTAALDDGMREHLERLRANPVAFNENEAVGGRGVSGRDMTKRDDFLRMLDGVRKKPGHPDRLDGIGGYDIKRITRDESGRDAGTIYRVLVKHRALLVTIERVYRLWLESDHDAYKLECLKAGWDIRSINTTFWRGIFDRAEDEPFFRGIPPVGYNNHEEVVPDPKRAEGSRIDRTPQKHPGEQALMADLVALLETATTQGEVADRLWATWGAQLDRHDRQRHKDMKGGWHAGRVAAILENPIYWGEWTLGGRCDRLNPLWDIAERREKFEHEGKYRHVLDGVTPCPCGRAHERIGSLAYWTRDQARAWRRRFSDGKPRRWTGKFDHVLLGVLACAACGEPMVGAGRHGYVCAGRNTRTCPEPQQLAERAALRVLDTLLSQALDRGRAAVERAVRLRERKRTPRAQLLAKKRRELASVQDSLATTLQAVGAVDAQGRKRRPASPTVQAHLQELMTREAALLADVERLEQGQTLARETLDAMAGKRDLLGWATDLEPQERGHLYRLLLAGVRVKGTGRGAGRTYAVVGEPRHLLEEEALLLEADTTIRAPSPRSTPAYVPTPPQALRDLLALLERAA